MSASSVNVSVSLPAEDAALIADLKRAGNYPTTSAVIHAGLAKLHDENLAAQYTEAFAASDGDEWSATEGDGWQ